LNDRAVLLNVFRSTQVGQTNFPKPHHFDVNDDVTMLASKTRPVHSIIPRGSGPDLPAWVAFDKQVLSFDAFYTEDVSQRPSEPYRVHRCKLMFYLEDDTMQVVEPRDDNSGLTQGQSRSAARFTKYLTINLPKT